MFQHVRSVAVLVWSIGLVASGCGPERLSVSDHDELSRIALTDEMRWRLEEKLNESLTALHMESDDIECFVQEVKASPYWRTESALDTPSLALPSEGFDEIARRCDIDVSELYSHKVQVGSD